MRVIPRAFAASLVAAGLCAGSADAAELGFYVGGSYGHAGGGRIDIAPFDSITRYVYERLEFVPSERGFTTSSDGTSYGFLGGYRFNQNWAVESGYMYIGKDTYREHAHGEFIQSDDEPSIPEDWTVSLTRKTSGFAISALGILPISYFWDVYARAGILVASNSMSLYASNGSFVGADQSSKSSIDWLAGAGIAVSLAEVYTVRAEFQRVFAVGHADFGESDVDVVSLGITVAF